jgi:hypothetical protein
MTEGLRHFLAYTAIGILLAMVGAAVVARSRSHKKPRDRSLRSVDLLGAGRAEQAPPADVPEQGSCL